MAEASAFGTTLRSVSSRIEGESLRLGLFHDGARVPRATVEGLDPAHAFELTGRLAEDTRYRCEKIGDEIAIHRWMRYAYEVQRVDDGQVGVLLVEAPARTEDVPLSPTDEARFTAELLHDTYQFHDVAPPISARVAGLSEQRANTHKFLSRRLGQWGLRERTGLLLTGPPGTGKTELVKEVCEQRYGEVPVTISGPEILNKWLGESEAALRRRFKRARDSSVPVLYIDEVDALGRTRQTADQAHTAQLVSQLLVLLDGVSTKESDDNLPTFEKGGEESPAADWMSLRVIASTNRPDTLDEALLRPGRLGDEVLQFGIPSSLERRMIFHHYLADMYARDAPLSESLEAFVTRDLGQLDPELIEATEEFTGADIEQAILMSAGNVQLTKRGTPNGRIDQSGLLEGIEATEQQRSTFPRHPDQASIDRFG